MQKKSEIERMMKRNSAETIKTCVVIFENIKNLGVGGIHSQFAPLIVAELKNKEEGRKKIAIEAFKLYTSHISDLNDLMMIIDLLSKNVTAGATADQRELFMHCFEYLHLNSIDALSNDGYNRISNQLIKSLIPILNKESNEQVREAIFGIIESIISTLNKLQLKVPAEALNKMLIACLSGKYYGNKTVSSTVNVLITMLDSKDEQNNELLKKNITATKEIWHLLNKCIISAKSNHKCHKDGLAAILATLYLCDNDQKLFDEHKEKKLSIINEYKPNAKSFFNHSGYIWSDSWDVSVLRVKIAEKLLNSSFFIKQYNALGDFSNFRGVWECLLYSTLHCDYRVRRYSCSVIRTMHNNNLSIKASKKKSQSFACLMVNMLQKYVGDLLASNACYMHPDKVKNGEMSQYEDIPLPIQFGDCLRAIAGDSPSKDAIIYILYLSHYPWFNVQAIRSKQQNIALWQRIINQWTKNTNAKSLKLLLFGTIHKNKQLEDLIRTDLTRIKYPIAQTAIMDSIACIFKISPRLITENEQILSIIDRALNASNDILDFTEKEKQICLTPEGVLCTFDDEHKSRSETEKNKKSGNRRKRNKKGTHIGDPTAGKKKGKGKKKKQAGVNERVTAKPVQKEKLLVKIVKEKGTKRLITDEEWEEEV